MLTGLTCAFAGAAAWATVGTPILGVPVGLEGDYSTLTASGTTDGNGVVMFSGCLPGNYVASIHTGLIPPVPRGGLLHSNITVQIAFSGGGAPVQTSLKLLGSTTASFKLTVPAGSPLAPNAPQDVTMTLTDTPAPTTTFFSNLDQPSSGSLALNNVNQWGSLPFRTGGVGRNIRSATMLVANNSSTDRGIAMQIYSDIGGFPHMALSPNNITYILGNTDFAPVTLLVGAGTVAGTIPLAANTNYHLVFHRVENDPMPLLLRNTANTNTYTGTFTLTFNGLSTGRSTVSSNGGSSWSDGTDIPLLSLDGLPEGLLNPNAAFQLQKPGDF